MWFGVFSFSSLFTRNMIRDYEKLAKIRQEQYARIFASPIAFEAYKGKVIEHKEEEKK